MAKYYAVLNCSIEEFMESLDSKCPYCKKSCKCSTCTELKKVKDQMEREKHERVKEKAR